MEVTAIKKGPDNAFKFLSDTTGEALECNINRPQVHAQIGDLRCAGCDWRENQIVFK